MGLPVQQSGLVTPGHLASWTTDGVLQDAGTSFGQTYGSVQMTSLEVNFNLAGDTAIGVNLPAGYTKYRIEQILISGATASITTATCGVFTGPNATGTAVVTGGTAVTVSQTLPDTVNNMQSLTINNQNTMALNDGVLFFNIATPQGVTAFANVSIKVQPLP